MKEEIVLSLMEMCEQHTACGCAVHSKEKSSTNIIMADYLLFSSPHREFFVYNALSEVYKLLEVLINAVEHVIMIIANA